VRKEVTGAAGEAVDARHRQLLAVDVQAAASGGAKLRELAVEGLPVGRDAGTRSSVFRMSFDHNLWQM